MQRHIVWRVWGWVNVLFGLTLGLSAIFCCLPNAFPGSLAISQTIRAAMAGLEQQQAHECHTAASAI
jgi:hypothetical protein